MVDRFCLGRRGVSEGLEEAAAVVPVARVAISTASRLHQGPWRRITSVLSRPMIDSAIASSWESPTEPIEGLAPASTSRSV